MPQGPFSTTPTVARWELWSVARMLISVHGDGAEAHARAKIEEAIAEDHEGNRIVWEGVLSQVAKIRAETR